MNSKILSRREVLAGSAAAVAVVSTAAAGDARAKVPALSAKARFVPRKVPVATPKDWNSVRNLFPLSRGTVHMSAMLIASHPARVREAIEFHRRSLDANPVEYLENNNVDLTEAVHEAAGNYLAISGSQIALTDSTTMGVGLVYSGLKLKP